MRTVMWMIAVCLIIQQTYATDIYIAPSGNDLHAGTAAQPKATLSAALRQAREWRRLNDPAIKDGTHIIMKGGEGRLLQHVNWNNTLYKTLNTTSKPITVRLIPYYAWAIRGSSDMSGKNDPPRKSTCLQPRGNLLISFCVSSF